MFIVLFIVIAKLFYNLGYRAVTQKFGPKVETPRSTTRANREAEGLRGVTIDPADSAEAAQMTAPAK
ncbi:hypothetical protein [Hymenobacter sp. B1770]|uniref:hypothetical protein n=1 Tax=Hymenobacter sp. B1770 TaxID=1718788 RepID=UPI003CF3D7A0